MNDNNLNNNSNKVNTYRATSNLNTAIENPQINVNSATGINIKNSNNNYYADAKQTDSKFLNNDIPNSTETNIDNYLNNDNNNNFNSNYQTPTNNYSYEPVMQKKKRANDNPISNLIHSKEFKTLIFIIFILVLFILIMPYIYDFFRNLKMSMTA